MNIKVNLSNVEIKVPKKILGEEVQLTIGKFDYEATDIDISSMVQSIVDFSGDH